MRNIILTALTITMVSMPLIAAKNNPDDDVKDQFIKQFREKNSILFRVGVDALGGKDDTSTNAVGDKKGLDRGMGFELSMGAEEKVENFEWGFRRIMTIYGYGCGTYYNETPAYTYQADTSNVGLETTAARYFKATQYFKPYIGVGLGININSYDDHGAYQKSDDYQFTVHAVGGVSGELFTGIGYYAEYKYRFAPSETLQIKPVNSLTTIEIENEGVNGGVFMAGLSYQF